jgi:hypothetical protein
MILRIAVLIAAVVQIPAAGILGAGTFETATREWPVFIQPAGWAFSIWGFIYIAALAFAVYQVIPKNDNQTLRAVRVPALIAFLGSIVWLYFAGASDWTVWLTIPTLFAMAGALTFVVAQPTLAAPWPELFSRSLLLPYAAWTGIAQWLNIQALLSDQGLITSGAFNTATNVGLLLCIAVYSLYWLRRSGYSVWYGGVIIWATIGVIAANTGTPDGSVIITTMAGALGLAAMALIRQNAQS